MGEGTVLPDFLLGKDATSFDTVDDTAYGRLLGVNSSAAFFAKDDGVWTSFQNGTGGLGLVQAWMGIKTAGQ